MFKVNNKKNEELTSEEEDIFEKNITWLFGSARGGTTWVARQLLSYQTISINEPHIEEHLSIRAIKNYNFPILRRIDNPQKNSDYFFSQEYSYIWKKFLRKLILNRFFVHTNDIHKKTIIKEPCSIGATDILTQCMNSSKIIFLFRDGRDVIDSILDARQKDGFMTKAVKNKPIRNRSRYIKNHSKLWVNRTEHFLNTYKNLPINLRYMVKYEDMLKDTQNELEKIYKFLEIDISNDKIQNIVTKYDFSKIPAREKGSGKFYRSASPGLWREHFSDEEQNMMNEIMGNTLKKVGYEI